MNIAHIIVWFSRILLYLPDYEISVFFGISNLHDRPIHIDSPFRVSN